MKKIINIYDLNLECFCCRCQIDNSILKSITIKLRWLDLDHIGMNRIFVINLIYCLIDLLYDQFSLKQINIRKYCWESKIDKKNCIFDIDLLILKKKKLCNHNR